MDVITGRHNGRDAYDPLPQILGQAKRRGYRAGDRELRPGLVAGDERPRWPRGSWSYGGEGADPLPEALGHITRSRTRWGRVVGDARRRAAAAAAFRGGALAAGCADDATVDQRSGAAGRALECDTDRYGADNLTGTAPPARRRTAACAFRARTSASYSTRHPSGSSAISWDTRPCSSNQES